MKYTYKETNLCLDCGCYDEDMGCTMPSIDRSYACLLEDENAFKDLCFDCRYKGKCETHCDSYKEREEERHV